VRSRSRFRWSESNEPRTWLDASGASGGSTARSASGEASKKPGAHLAHGSWFARGRPCRLRLARDGHRSPAFVGADRRDGRPEEQVIHLHSESASNEPDEGGRSARRRAVYPPPSRRVNLRGRLCRQRDSDAGRRRWGPFRRHVRRRPRAGIRRRTITRWTVAWGDWISWTTSKPAASNVESRPV
jgi:hypothetical protein